MKALRKLSVSICRILISVSSGAKVIKIDEEMPEL